MLDWVLAGTLGILQLVLGFMGIYVALRPPEAKHHLRWIFAFVGVGFTGVVLIVLTAIRTGHAQDAMKEQLTAQIQSLQISQAREEGQVTTISGIMGGIAKTGIPGLKEFAESVLRAVQASKQVSAQSRITNAQLCERTTSLAKSIRSFEIDFGSTERTEQDKMMRQLNGATREQMIAINENYARQEMQRSQTHRDEFETRYLSDAKYDHDQIIDRLSAAQRDELTSRNGEAETIVSVGHLVGAMSAYGVANYLDGLAKTLCSGKNQLAP
jgi:hypothetical protein